MVGADPGFPDDEVVATQILVVSDLERSRAWWVDVLGATPYRHYGGTSLVLSFAGIWILLVTGGPPTPDKPTVTFGPPDNLERVSHAMTLRVADCRAVHASLSARGATFLTPPHDWGAEIRAFLRDPDGHLLEISQTST
ncbi:MAG TPA: VOC family protein [Pseudonocardiaceae bacterium]|jgi:catechol 2,3-dioxygenase-like lactoylglutathione lyase family enzyme